METANNLQIDVLKTLKMIMLDKKTKQYEAAEKLGMDKRPYNRLIQKGDELRVRELAKIADNVVVKVPLMKEGLKAVKTLTPIVP
jgi:DNA-binding Xre family transcriptional regulator